MGQILKNFPGSLDGARKEAIAKETFGVALRTMGWLFETIRENEEELCRAVSDVIQRRQDHLTPSEAEQKARAMLGLFLTGIAFGFIRDVVQNTGSRHLKVTYSRIFAMGQHATMRLIKVALDLEVTSAFPASVVRELADEFRDNQVALEVLRYLVIHHFHLFVVDTSTKQSICSTLGISYPGIEATRREWQRLSRS